MRCMDVAAKRGRFVSDPGDPIHIVYSPELQKDGQILLVAIGKENTDEIIASHLEETSLEVILAKFANGDTSALNKYQPIYADLTQAPKTLAESLQTVINSRRAFDALPVDVKSQFGNSFERWLATSGTAEWFDMMKPVFPVKNENISEAAATERSEDSGASIKE